MDICFECKIKKAITILLCGECDDKLKEQIKKKMGRIGIGHLKIISYLNNKQETITKYYIN